MKKQPRLTGGERVELYDWLRVIATILVVIGHSMYLEIGTTHGGVSYELPPNINHIYNAGFVSWLQFLADWVYGFHMPLFFMLSGAMLQIKPLASYDEIVKAKTKRLLIPYFFWGWFFMLPIKRIGGFYTNETLRQAMYGFLSGQDAGHLWFLTALFWSTLVFVCLKKLLEKLGINSFYFLLIITGILQLTYNYLPFDILGLKKGLNYIFYLGAGYVFEYEREEHDAWNIKKLIGSIVVLMAIEILDTQWGILNAFFTVICGSFLIYLISDLCSRELPNMLRYPIWRMVVRNLFYVYIFHDPLEYVVLRIFMNSDLLISACGCVLYILSRTVIVFGISIALGELVSKVKVFVNKGVVEKV